MPAPPAQSTEPAQLVEAVASALLAKDVEAMRAALGGKLVDTTIAAGLQDLLGPKGYVVDAENAVSRIGSQPSMQLWALHLRQPDHPGDRAVVELAFTRGSSGQWRPARIILPEHAPGDTPGQLADPAAAASATTFARAILAADFPTAIACAARGRLSPEAMVGLAVLAGEGEYRLRESAPLTTTLANKASAWFLVQVVSPKWQVESRFGMVLQPAADGTWQVTALNLDSLQAVSAIRLGAGDSAFTPLIRIPGEGEALAVYFDTKSSALDARGLQLVATMARWLEIEANLAPRIAGHGDAGENDGVERAISKARAETVAAALATAGIDRGRITTEAYGASKPRRANFRPDGTADSAGRRLNRRVEVHFTR